MAENQIAEIRCSVAFGGLAEGEVSLQGMGYKSGKFRKNPSVPFATDCIIPSRVRVNIRQGDSLAPSSKEVSEFTDRSTRWVAVFRHGILPGNNFRAGDAICA